MFISPVVREMGYYKGNPHSRPLKQAQPLRMKTSQKEGSAGSVCQEEMMTGEIEAQPRLK